MKKKLLIIFIIITFILGALLIGRFVFFHQKPIMTGSKTIVPKSKDSATQNTTSSLDSEEKMQVTLTSFIPLESDETLIGTHSIDLNNDTFEDQIVAIKKSTSPFITLIVGLYKPKLTKYERTMEIATEISQVKTFSFTTMDITGERKNTLLYSGFTDTNDSVLQAFNGSVNDYGVFVMHKIVDLKSDGSIYIEQIQRTDAYAMSLVNGESFPIWVYSSDTENNKESFDQIQTKYTWDKTFQMYSKQYETRVAGNKIAAKELARIQDGTVETFISFLDGLWFQSANKTDETRYLFFDKAENEIVFLLDQIQEIYTITNSTIRRSGIFMSAANKSIQNLTRRLDITLVSTDTIRIRLNDDLRMSIKSDSVWDGQYKKMTGKIQNTEKKTNSLKSNPISLLKTIKEPWQFLDGNRVSFENNQFIIHNDQGSQEFAISQIEIKGKTLLQCKSDGKYFTHKFYDIKKIEMPKDSSKELIELIPVLVNTDGYFPTNEATIKLERVIATN